MSSSSGSSSAVPFVSSPAFSCPFFSPSPILVCLVLLPKSHLSELHCEGVLIVAVLWLVAAAAAAGNGHEGI